MLLLGVTVVASGQGPEIVGPLNGTMELTRLELAWRGGAAPYRLSLELVGTPILVQVPLVDVTPDSTRVDLPALVSMARKEGDGALPLAFNRVYVWTVTDALDRSASAAFRIVPPDNALSERAALPPSAEPDAGRGAEGAGHAPAAPPKSARRRLSGLLSLVWCLLGATLALVAASLLRRRVPRSGEADGKAAGTPGRCAAIGDMKGRLGALDAALAGLTARFASADLAAVCPPELACGIQETRAVLAGLLGRTPATPAKAAVAAPVSATVAAETSQPEEGLLVLLPPPGRRLWRGLAASMSAGASLGDLAGRATRITVDLATADPALAEWIEAAHAMQCLGNGSRRAGEGAGEESLRRRAAAAAARFPAKLNAILDDALGDLLHQVEAVYLGAVGDWRGGGDSKALAGVRRLLASMEFELVDVPVGTGARPNPQLHTVIAEEDVSDATPGSIVKVLAMGYRDGKDGQLRKARVAVAQGR